MSDKKIDNMLSGIIILLVIVVVWKWYQDDMKPSKCRRNIRKGLCNCKEGECKCFKSQEMKLLQKASRDGIPNKAGDEGGSYDDALLEMALEDSVKNSHKKYVKSLAFSGNPTGASHNTDNDSLGMSYEDGGNYHGLTRRKWCRARNLVEVGEEARVVPSDSLMKEECYIGMNELV